MIVTTLTIGKRGASHVLSSTLKGTRQFPSNARQRKVIGEVYPQAKGHKLMLMGDLSHLEKLNQHGMQVFEFDMAKVNEAILAA